MHRPTEYLCVFACVREKSVFIVTLGQRSDSRPILPKRCGKLSELFHMVNFNPPSSNVDKVWSDRIKGRERVRMSNLHC